MTIEELRQLPYIIKAIQINEAIIYDIDESISIASPDFSGMPHGSNNSSSTERIALDNIKRKDEYEKELKELKKERQRLECYIATMRNINTRNMFRLAFVKGYSYSKIADAMSGEDKTITKLTVSRAISRYLITH